jgi:hypothetical protein
MRRQVPRCSPSIKWRAKRSHLRARGRRAARASVSGAGARGATGGFCKDLPAALWQARPPDEPPKSKRLAWPLGVAWPPFQRVKGKS